MKTLPKIKTSGLPTWRTANRQGDQEGEVFFKREHPDHRTNVDWLTKMVRKGILRSDGTPKRAMK